VSLFEVESLPVSATDRINARAGNRNSARKATTTDPGPWADWPKSMSLTARVKRWIETYCIPAKGHGHGKPIKLAQFQLDWLEEVLSGRIDSSVMTLPRGNGKSTFGGAFGAWALFDQVAAEHLGGQPQIPVIAVTLKQAKRGIYGAALAFTKKHPDLADRSIIYTAAGDERIVVPGNLDGDMFPTAADVDGLQGLDPSLSLVDEIGFIAVEAWDSLLLAAGKRERSLTLGLGTRSPDDTPNALDHLVAQVAAHGIIKGFLLVDYAARPDADPGDRREWIKANPAAQEGYLELAALEQAFKLSPRAAFQVYRLNIKTGSHTGWLGVEGPVHWDATSTAVELDPKLPVAVGVDKSAYSDCSAIAALQHDPVTGKWRTKVWVFLPDGDTIDHAAVKAQLRQLHEAYELSAVGYDDRYFVEGAAELADAGLPLEKVPQTAQRLVPAYSHLYRMIVERQLEHDDDPILRGHILAAVPQMQSAGGFMLAKNKSRHHIDAAVALGIARYVHDMPPEPTHEIEDFLTF
jgi:phage terminase large subunit-like protein